MEKQQQPFDAGIAPVQMAPHVGSRQYLEIYTRVGCWSGSEDGLESTALESGIPEGDAACVRSIDVVFDAAEADHVCHGYRSLEGEWRYDLTPIEPTLDASGRPGPRTSRSRAGRWTRSRSPFCTTTGRASSRSASKPCRRTRDARPMGKRHPAGTISK